MDDILPGVPRPLLCADAPFLLYRAFFALPDSITGPDDRPVNALLGAVNQTLAEVERHDPRVVVMCFGQESADYRTDAYPDYHAARPEMPDDLRHQWEQAPALFQALGWVVLTSPDHEADDLLGALGRAEEAAGGRALILTGDRDMFQCATEQVHLLLQQRGKQYGQDYGPEEVLERYGVRPEQVPDFIALRGDPSDGLPGAKGIGEKTGADLLARHGTLEAAIDAAVREKPGVRKALLGDPDLLRTFKHVATLQDVPIERPDDAATDGEGGAKAAEAFGMKRLATRLLADFAA